MRHSICGDSVDQEFTCSSVLLTNICYRAVILLFTTYIILANILYVKLVPYVEQII